MSRIFLALWELCQFRCSILYCSFQGGKLFLCFNIILIQLFDWVKYYSCFDVAHFGYIIVRHGSILSERFWIGFLFCSMLSSFMDLPPWFYCGTASTFTAPSAHNPYLVSCSIGGDVLVVRGTWRCCRCPQALEGLQDSSGPWPAPGQRQQLGQQPDPWRWPPPCPRAKPLHPPPVRLSFINAYFPTRWRV